MTVTHHLYLDVISASFSASILPSSRHTTVLSKLKSSRKSVRELKTTDLTLIYGSRKIAISYVCICYIYMCKYMHES